jgi:hypothetical protein
MPQAREYSKPGAKDVWEYLLDCYGVENTLTAHEQRLPPLWNGLTVTACGEESTGLARKGKVKLASVK